MPEWRSFAQLHGWLGPMTAACFLLFQPEDERETSLRRFLVETLPQLLPQLNRTTAIERVETSGYVRGRVDWPATHKARWTAEGGLETFICRENRRRFDRPENQLLVFLLKRAHACLDRIPAEMHGWWTRCAGGSTSLIGAELAEVAYRLSRLRTNVSLSEVSVPTSIGSQHLAAARTSKNELYSKVADLYFLYRDVVEVADWQRWTHVLRWTAPLPPDVDATTRRLLTAL